MCADLPITYLALKPRQSMEYQTFGNCSNVKRFPRLASRAVEQFDNSQQCSSFCTSGRSRTDHAATTHVARETNLFTVPAKPVVSASPTSPGFRNRIMSFEMRFSYPRPDYPMPKLRRGKFEVCVNFSSDTTQFLINFRVQNSLMLLLKNLYC